ncbi:hypothetical protein EVAR_13206_1 [Eumeta japonica]|uniref:Uncharacterized protein n=1 Tax=Eumeta variegata TaxID=151549 RepID=A0A4C1TS39_EUMVA|nr:hypothetical protein EVAR_13206_1 [Eumeta japonica]
MFTGLMISLGSSKFLNKLSRDTPHHGIHYREKIIPTLLIGEWSLCVKPWTDRHTHRKNGQTDGPGETIRFLWLTTELQKTLQKTKLRENETNSFTKAIRTPILKFERSPYALLSKSDDANFRLIHHREARGPSAAINRAAYFVKWFTSERESELPADATRGHRALFAASPAFIGGAL